MGRVWFLSSVPLQDIFPPPSKDLLVSWIMYSDSKSNYLLTSWKLFFKPCETLKNVTNFLSSLNTHHSVNWGWKPSGKPAWDYFCFLYECSVRMFFGLGSWGFFFTFSVAFFYLSVIIPAAMFLLHDFLAANEMCFVQIFSEHQLRVACSLRCLASCECRATKTGNVRSIGAF